MKIQTDGHLVAIIGLCLLLATASGCGEEKGVSGAGNDVGSESVDAGDASIPLPDGTAESDAEVSDGGGPLGSAIITVPIVPVSAFDFRGEINEVPRSSDDGPATLLATRQIELAWGENYPTSLAVNFTGLTHRLIVPCYPIRGAVELTSVEGSGVASATLVEPNSLTIEARGEGVTTFLLRGHYTAPEGGEAQNCGEFFPSGENMLLEITLMVTVRRPVSVELEPRDCPNRLIGGSTLQKIMPTIRLFDADGDGFTPQNASPTSPIELIVTAPNGAELISDEEGAGSIRLGLAAGQLRIEGFGEELMEFEVLAPSRITSLDVRFDIPGVAAGPFPLTSGERYGQEGWGRKGRQIAPVLPDGLVVDGEKLCATPAPAWFELVSLTPDICEIIDPVVFQERDALGGRYLYYDDLVGHAAYPLIDGTCELRLDAPLLNGGEGITHSLTVTLDNVEQLF